MHLALYTFGQFIRPAEAAQNDGFHAINDAVLRAIEAAPGFVARSGYDDDENPKSWGFQTYPRFRPSHPPPIDDWAPSTLSLWRDINSAQKATYSGLHLRALKQGRKWFQQGDWPGLVMWWIHSDRLPNWTEGSAKLEALHDHGPTPAAFTFTTAFDATGAPITPNP